MQGEKQVPILKVHKSSKDWYWFITEFINKDLIWFDSWWGRSTRAILRFLKKTFFTNSAVIIYNNTITPTATN